MTRFPIYFSSLHRTSFSQNQKRRRWSSSKRLSLFILPYGSQKTKKAARTTNARKRRAELSDIPACLMVDMLSRLPIKSIIYSMCVCKTWFILISDPVFIELQQARSPTCILFRTTSQSKKLQLAQVEQRATTGFHVDEMRFPKTSFAKFDFSIDKFLQWISVRRRGV